MLTADKKEKRSTENTWRNSNFTKTIISPQVQKSQIHKIQIKITWHIIIKLFKTSHRDKNYRYIRTERRVIHAGKKEGCDENENIRRQEF